MDTDQFAIGSLRWRVWLATREQIADASGTGIIETFTDTQPVHASIKPIGLQTYIGSEQIDSPITHRIVLRWSDSLDTFDVVLRETQRPDGSRRQEIFRIRRVSEWQGRKRFSILDCELERRDG